MISFLKFSELDVPLLQSWLKQPHVRDFWRESQNFEELKNKFVIELPKRGIFAFVIKNDSVPIGFIQYYEACRVGGGWWEHELPGVFGIDLMIGESNLIGKGIGSAVITSFVEFVTRHEPTITSVIIDPDPKNLRAIRSFEKAGFQRDHVIETPAGKALLMRKVL